MAEQNCHIITEIKAWEICQFCVGKPTFLRACLANWAVEYITISRHVGKRTAVRCPIHYDRPVGQSSVSVQI
jgi:hypothetical protein